MRSLTRLSLLSTLLCASLAHADSLPEPIRQLQDKGAVIKGRFETPGGLQGYAAEYQNSAMALYLTPDGQHVLVGTLFDDRGQDLSAEPLERLVYGPMGEAVWGQLAQSAWIADGQDEAPQTLYVFSDPNCPYCTLFWEQVRPWVTSGKVQVRHVMVGIIRPDSLGKSAALLAAKDPAKALADHEKAGRSSPLAPLAPVPAALGKRLEANQALMQSLGLSATPAIFYRDKQGRLQSLQGAPGEERLAAVLGQP
ncbi:thiol:disulfide interchange protein DsbG [Pseudomonas entomophila]|uniref:thiol:disulfide interchange protein DsbG n=1 Tax=Pseudomonas entomophila TaxID=312306 RepID=UPI003EBC6808